MIRRLLITTLYHCGGDLLVANRARRDAPRLCVLSGHRIVDEERVEKVEDARDVQRGCLTLTGFRQAIGYLKRHYEIISLDDALAAGEHLPRRAVVLTFDDAFKDVAVHAHPMLSGAGIPFTVFQTTSYLGVNPRMLDRDDLENMREDPLVTWGSHGVTHRPFTELDDTELDRQFHESRAALEDILEKPVRYLCYPDGAYDERVVARARAAGYEAACTTGRILNTLPLNPFAIKRIPFDNEPIARFAFRVAGRT